MQELTINIIFLILYIIFISTIADVLRYVREENRKADPLSAWYLLIPIFNIIWFYILVFKISKAIHNEYISRNLSINKYPTLILGLLSAILVPLSITSHLIDFDNYNITISLDNASVIGRVIWLIYFAQLYQYKKKLKQFRINDSQ
jgi:hypothetical protein